MQNSSKPGTRLGLLLSLFVLGLVAAFVVVPSQFRSEAVQVKTGDGLIVRTSSSDDGLPKMFDIRDEKSDATTDALARFRESIGTNAAAVATAREGFVRGEKALIGRLPHAKIEYNNDIRIPEVITPDVFDSKIEFLSPPSTAKRSEILRGFVKQNDELIGVSDAQADALSVAADYTNPDGNMSYAHLEQFIDGVPVFRGEVKAGFTKDGRIVRVVNNLAPGLDYGSLSSDFRNPLDAVRVAAGHIKHELSTESVTRNPSESTANKVVFGSGDWATTAERMYFPTEPGVAVPSWRVLIWQPVNAYYVIVDAHSGVVLWHKNIVDDQTQAATYQVYGNTNAYIDAADSPAPLTPFGGANPDPGAGTQGALLTRSNRTLIGNEGSLSFNNLGWITDGANITDGNANEAGIDRVAPNGVDAPMVGTPNREFTSLWNPPPGSPAPGDEPLTAEAQRGAVIQMFYLMNRYHDELYKRGFTEAARNYQNDNFGRNPGGGTPAAIAGMDRVSSEGQDSSGTNNANFASGADGVRGRMQMFLWSGPTPDKDGTPDGDIVIHEVTHGTSNRLHGNSAGLGGMGGMMGEGWSDWYGHVMLAEPSDPINGIYTIGGYATHLLGGQTANYYYGIRRFPKAVMAFKGGPNRPACNNGPCPYNPLTFGHINSTCDATLGTSTTAVSSAFPRSAVISPAGSCNQVHNAGEIWSSALWEVRARMVTRLGFTAGTTRVLQVVTDGMKLAPLNPSFLQERDAIIAAAAALPVAPEASADVADVREGFRIRGMGFSASVTSTAVVTEAFDVPNAVITNPFSVADPAPGGDGDGFPEPGETVVMSVPVINSTGGAVNNVVVQATGGGSANYGNLADAQTEVRSISYLVPADAICGSVHTVTFTLTSSAGSSNFTRSFTLGSFAGAINNTSITIPNVGPGLPYPSNIAVSGISGTAAVRVRLFGLTHTFPGDIDLLLVGPGGQKMIIMSDNGSNSSLTNANVVLEDAAAANMPTTATSLAGTWKPTNSGASDPFVAPAPVGPYENPAPAGAATFASVFGTSGAAMNGTWSLYVVDDAGGDLGSLGGGWAISFATPDFACSTTPLAVRSRADFDGDGKTDVSVFRPSEGNWYLNQSTAGFGVLNWGISTDRLIPGDYDGDGKADAAIFRATADPSQPDFYMLRSNGFTVTGVSWGIVGDLPINGDYDGDGRTDAAIYRPATNTFFILNSSNGANTVATFGSPGDVPIAIDNDGDGKDNIAVFRPSNNTWYIARPTGVPGTNFDAVAFGSAGDRVVPADYDGDNKGDIAVFRPSNGTWYIRRSTDATVQFVAWGANGDVPAPGDYDGDGKDDPAVYRGGIWYLNRSTAGISIVSFGLGTDTPVPSKYVP